MSSIRRLSVLGILAAAIGCEGAGWEEPNRGGAAEPAAVEPVRSELFFWSGAQPWPNSTVPICFHPESAARPDFPTYSRYVKNWARYSWPTVSNVTFTGFGVCAQPPIGPLIQIVLTDGDDGGSGWWGLGTYSVFLTVKGLSSPGQVAHELGHALGFLHEMDRPDFQDDFSSPRCFSNGKDSGDTLGTAPDRKSIMTFSYCPDSSGGELSNFDAVGVRKKYGTRVGAFLPVVTWTDYVSWDTVAASAPTGRVATNASGWLFQQQLPGTVPLKRYRISLLGRTTIYRAVADPTTEAEVKSAGYSFVSTEGFIFPASTPIAATVPLYTWRSSAGYYQTTTQPPGSGWSAVRLEGWVFADRPYDLLWLMWKGTDRQDNMIGSQGANFVKGYLNLNDPTNEGWSYDFQGLDSALLKVPAPGTVPLKTFFHAGFHDHFTTATKVGEDWAIATGYKYFRTDGYVYPTAQPGTIPLRTYWSQGRLDHMTTAAVPLPPGYADVRTEGYVFPL
jgi:hypothetical protein